VPTEHSTQPRVFHDLWTVEGATPLHSLLTLTDSILTSRMLQLMEDKDTSLALKDFASCLHKVYQERNILLQERHNVCIQMPTWEALLLPQNLTLYSSNSTTPRAVLQLKLGSKLVSINGQMALEPRPRAKRPNSTSVFLDLLLVLPSLAQQTGLVGMLPHPLSRRWWTIIRRTPVLEV